MCGSTVGWRGGKVQRPKARGNERREVCIDYIEYLEQSLQAKCIDEMCHIFLMPAEEILWVFSQMGFHIKCCLCVYLMNVLMPNECMCICLWMSPYMHLSHCC